MMDELESGTGSADNRDLQLVANEEAHGAGESAAFDELGISEDSDYHRVSRGCPKGYTQQCGSGYRT